ELGSFRVARNLGVTRDEDGRAETDLIRSMAALPDQESGDEYRHEHHRPPPPPQDRDQLGYFHRIPRPLESSRTIGSVRAALAQDRRGRPPHDLEVEPGRPVLRVVEIEAHHLVERQIAPPVDLPQARQTGRHEEPLAVPVFVGGNLLWERGPGSDDA